MVSQKPTSPFKRKRRVPKVPGFLCLPGMSNLAQTSVAWSANVEVCFQPNRRGAGKSLAAL